MEYQKINTLFMRDDKKIIMPDSFSKDEFRYLSENLFECTEKIDGTNIRIEITNGDNGICVKYKGRTDNANIPGKLLEKLNELFPRDLLMEVFNLTEDSQNVNITIFGEGYGAKIQKGGGRYISNGVNFILFDVNIDGWWLLRSNLEDIAEKLNIDIVPLVGYMNIYDAIAYVRDGFLSNISEDKTLPAEGLVLKTPQGLCFRNGERIIAKIKTCDFEKYNKAYAKK
jgi:hypothetical protein